MSQQALDVRSSIKTVRRHIRLFGAAVVLGLLVGAAYAVLRPPMLSATALVVLPQSAAASTTTASGTGSSDIATQVVVASSYSVLARALSHVSPAMSLQTLQNRVQVQNNTGSIISITATGATAAEAETTANAVANSYIAYVRSKNSPVGQVSATMLQSATSATGSKLPMRIAIDGLLGLFAGALVGFVTALAMSSNDRRLVERDAIANSIGAPVLASVPVSHPSDAAAWAKLLEEYEPGVVHAWSLTRMLRQFGLGEAAGNKGRASLAILSLASDPGALALGPQIAAFAAAQGIPTVLFMGPQQDMNVTATLRTACAAPLRAPEGRRKLPQLIVADDGYLGQLRAAFVVVVAVIDGRAPVMPNTLYTTATVLGVSAGAATAEQLARAATAAAADGREIVGILVADPDPSDQSTGLVPRLTPSLRRLLPTRVDDVPTESRR